MKDIEAMKNSFIFHNDYQVQLDLLTDEEAGALIKALVRYSSTGERPSFGGAAGMAFSFMAAQMDRELTAYVAKCERNSENGSKGGRPKKEEKNQAVFEETQKTERFSEKPKKADKDNDKDKDKEKDNIPPIVPPRDGRNLSPLSKTQTERFEKFWQAYPRKESKGAAERAWKKINPDDELTQTITEAIGRAQKLDNRFRERQYTPHPSVWLNGREWENEYDASRSPPGPGSIDFGFEQRSYDDDFYNSLVRGFDE